MARLSRAPFVIISCTLLLFAITEAVVFISPNGDDAADCLAEVTACKSLTRAYEVATAGDEVMVLAGEYNITTSQEIVPTKAVTFRGLGPSQTIIRGNVSMAPLLAISYSTNEAFRIRFVEMTIITETASSPAVSIKNATVDVHDCQLITSSSSAIIVTNEPGTNTSVFSVKRNRITTGSPIFIYLAMAGSEFTDNIVTSFTGLTTLMAILPARQPFSLTFQNNTLRNTAGVATGGLLFEPPTNIRGLNATFPPSPHYTLSVTGCTFENIRSVNYGALTINGPADVNVIGSVFRSNIGGFGSAISILSGRQIQVISSTFEGNYASGSGTIYRGNPFDDVIPTSGAQVPVFVISSCNFSNNIAASGGGGAYVNFITRVYPNIPLIENSNFTGNAGTGSTIQSSTSVIGGALVFAGAHANSAIRGCRFIGNSVTSSNTNDTVVAGGAVYLAGTTTTWTITNNVFDGNYALAPLRTASGGAFASSILMSGHSYDFRNNVFQNNWAAGLYFRATRGSTGGGAVALLQLSVPLSSFGTVTVSMVDATFVNNSAVIIPSQFGDNNAQGGALYVGMSDPSVPTSVVLNVRNTLFERNTADVAGGILVFNSLVDVNSCTFKLNTGEELGGAIAALSANSIIPETTLRVRNSIFDGNRVSPIDPLERSYTDVFAQDTALEVFNCTFANGDWDPTIPFSSAVGVVGEASLTIKPAANQAVGTAVSFPPVFVGPGALLNISTVTATFDILTLWYRAGSFPDGRGQVLLGNYDATVLQQFIMNNGSIRSQGMGHLHLRGRSEIITKGPNTFIDTTVHNHARLNHYESDSFLKNSTLINEATGTWRFVNFNPQVRLISSDNSTSSTFSNAGQVVLATAFTEGIQFVQTASGRLTYVFSNFWNPSTLAIAASGAQGSAELDGTFNLDFSRLTEFTEPRPFQQVKFMSAPTGTIMGDFSAFSHVGGYVYIVNRVTEAGQDNLLATVSGFYPRRVVFSNTGTSIVVTFPRATNSAGLGQCSQILQSSTLTALGSSHSCVWRTPSELIITSSAFPPVGSSLNFVPGVIQDAIDPSFTVSGVSSIVIEAPDAPAAPTAVIVGPKELPSCDDLILDGTASYGGGVLPLTYRWNLNSSDSADAALIAFVAALSGPTVTIPSANFPAGSRGYLFQLVVNSTFGVVSQVSSHLVTRYADARPQILIEGPETRFHPASEALKLQGRVAFASCTATADFVNVLVNWEQLSGPSPRLPATTLTSSSLFFPAGALEAGVTYSFRFTARFRTATATAEVNVRAVGAPMTLLSSGDGGYIPFAAPATFTVNLIDPSAGSSNISYTWLAIRCPVRSQINTNTGGGKDPEIAYSAREIGPGDIFDSKRLSELLLTRPTGVICSDIANNTITFAPATNSSVQHSITVPANTMVEGDYLLAVIANKDSRSAQSLISFSVTSATSFSRSVKVDLRPRLVQGSKILPDQRLAINGFLNNVGDIVPTTLQVQYVERDLANASISSSARTRTFSGSLNQVIEAGTLSPGRFYFLELQAQSRNGRDVVGSNRVVLPVNSAPTGGALTVSPATGGLQYQEYTFSAPNWNDDADQPLQYIFSVSTDLNETNAQSDLVLSDGIEIPSIKILLPIAGSVSQGNRIRVTLRVKDSLGATTTRSVLVEALPNTLSISTQFARLQQNLLRGDVTSLVSELISLLTALNANPESADTVGARERIADIFADYASTQPLTEANLNILFMAIRLLVAEPTRMTPNIRDSLVSIFNTTLPPGNFSATAELSLVAIDSVSSQRTVTSLLFAIRDFILACSPEKNYTTTRLTFNQALTIYDIARRLAVLQGNTAVVGEQGSSVGIDILMINSVLTSIGQFPEGVRFTIGTDGSLVITQTGGNNSTSSVVSTVVWLNGSFPLTSVATNGTILGSTVITVSGYSETGNTFTITADLTPSASNSSATPTACGILNPSTLLWETANCNLQITRDLLGQPHYVCTCADLLSTAGTSSTAPTTRTLGLLFSVGGSNDGVPSSGSGVPSQSQTTGSGEPSANTVAIIAGCVVAGVVVLALIIGAIVYKQVFLKRKQTRAIQMQRIRQSQARANSKSGGSALDSVGV